MIDSVFDSGSELGIQNPIYDTLYGRQRADTPHESKRPIPDNISHASIPSTAIYATITDFEENERPTLSIQEDKCGLKSCHKISIVLIIFLGNVLHKQGSLNTFMYIYIQSMYDKMAKVKHKT